MEEFDLEDPFQGIQSGTVSSLFDAESDHMPTENYFHGFISGDFDVSFRQNAVSFITKAQFACGFDPSVAYLAITYLDRFASGQEISHGKPWILKLLCISCLSLAAKMRKVVCSFADFQSEEGLIFDSDSIRRMELLILGALKWRMRSITPFSFLPFFLSYCKFKDIHLEHCLKARAAKIIFKAQSDTKLLRYKPSLIGASALLSACHEFLPIQFPCFRTAISACIFVNNDELLECYSHMQKVVLDGYSSMFDTLYSSETPVCVLDHHCSSSESENTCVARPEPEIKRRKTSNYCKKKTFQLSQIPHC